MIDCPAGVEDGFKNAVSASKEAIVVTNPESCPKKYIDMGGDIIKYCEITPAGLGYTWSLKEE